MRLYYAPILFLVSRNKKLKSIRSPLPLDNNNRNRNNNSNRSSNNNSSKRPMDFPDDIWRTILEYFPSPYKKPTHYEAILETPSFYFARQRTRNRLSARRRLDFDAGTANWESYYERLVTTGKGLRRGVAQLGGVTDEFTEIFRIYRERNGTNQAHLIQYRGA